MLYLFIYLFIGHSCITCSQLTSAHLFIFSYCLLYTWYLPLIDKYMLDFMQSQVIEPVWQVSAFLLLCQFLRLYLTHQDQHRRKTVGWQNATSIHPSEPVWTCTAFSVTSWGRSWTHAHTELFQCDPSNNSLKTVPLDLYDWMGQDLTCFKT